MLPSIPTYGTALCTAVGRRGEAFPGICNESQGAFQTIVAKISSPLLTAAHWVGDWLGRWTAAAGCAGVHRHTDHLLEIVANALDAHDKGHKAPYAPCHARHTWA